VFFIILQVQFLLKSQIRCNFSTQNSGKVNNFTRNIYINEFKKHKFYILLVMDDKLNKKFYKIGDVAEILNIPSSTLRYWEKEFTVIKPKRNAKNIRVYTVKDIETIKMINYLVKEKGLKLDAAQAMIKRNRDGISKQHEVVERLKAIKLQLLNLDEALASVVV